MKIDTIKWISDEAKEAVLKVSDGEHFCFAFCQPCNYQIGEIIQGPLYSFDEKSVIKLEKNMPCYIVQNISNDGCEVVAEVYDVIENLVKVGNILIQVSLPLPKDIRIGNKVIFYPQRLDIF